MPSPIPSYDVAGRVAHQLLLLAEDHGVPDPGGGVRIELRLTPDDIARSVGATRVRVNQALGRLRRSGAVAVDLGYRVVIRDPAVLHRHR